jgi:hypothetical protein
VPGFLSGARYEAVKGGPKHLACYELESVAVLYLGGGAARAPADAGRGATSSDNGRFHQLSLCAAYALTPPTLGSRRQ